MTRSRVVLLCASLVCACLLAGCARDHREFARTLPYLDIRDDAGIIIRSIRGALEAESQRAKQMEVHIAVLTVPDTGALEPIVFANRAFESYPTYHTAFQEPLDKPDKKRFKKTAPAWSPRGVLICVSLEPRLVQVRMGQELRYAIRQKDFWHGIEGRVCPLVMRKRSREAIVAAVRVVLERLEQSEKRDQRPRWWWRIDRAMMELTSFSYPDWRPYHWVLFRPVINSLALVLKLTNRQAWGLVAWLLLLFLVPPLLVWRWQTSPEVDRTRGGGIAAWLILIWILGRIPLFLPVYAVLNLLVFPYWENVVAVKQHLYPAVAHGIDPHDLFALRSGLLWWPDGHAPAGFWMAAIYMVIALSAALLRLAVAKEPGEDEFKGIYSAIIYPVASAFIPFVLTLFMLLWSLGSLAVWFPAFIRKVRYSGAAR